MKNERIRALNPPKRIYLQVGDIVETCEFSDCDEVTWCEDSMYDTDIEYRLVKRRKRRAASNSTEGL